MQEKLPDRLLIGELCFLSRLFFFPPERVAIFHRLSLVAISRDSSRFPGKERGSEGGEPAEGGEGAIFGARARSENHCGVREKRGGRGVGTELERETRWLLAGRYK